MTAYVWVRDLPVHMAEALGGARRLVGWGAIRIALLAAFLFASFASTFGGLYDLMVAGLTTLYWLGFLAALVLAAAVVCLMWVALETVLWDRRIGRRALAFFFYAFFVLWSLAFGFGFYWKLFSAADVAREDFASMGTRITIAMSRTAQTIQGIHQQADELAETARGSANAELTGGGGCEGHWDSGKGDGPYNQTRLQIISDVEKRAAAVKDMFDLDDFRKFSDDIVKEIRTSANDRTITSQAAMEAKYREIGGRARSGIAETNGVIGLFSTSTEIGRLQSYEAQLRSGVPSPPSASRRVTCVDSKLANDVRDLRNYLLAVQPIPMDAADFMPRFGAAATNDSFVRFLRNLGAWVTFQEVDSASRFKENDRIALFAAIAIDLGVFFSALLGLTGEPLLRFRRTLAGGVRDQRFQERLSRLARYNRSNLAELLDLSIAVDNGRHYLIASEDLPGTFATVVRIQAALAAAGEGRYVDPRAPALRTGNEVIDGAIAWLAAVIGPHSRLDSIRRRLSSTAQRLEAMGEGPSRRSRAAHAFPAGRIVAMRVSADVLTALRLTLADIDAGRAAADAAPPPPEPPPDEVPPRPDAPRPRQRPRSGRNPTPRPRRPRPEPPPVDPTPEPEPVMDRPKPSPTAPAPASATSDASASPADGPPPEPPVRQSASETRDASGPDIVP